MFLLVGLGNPGASYAFTRHNAGFLAVEEVARACGAGGWTEKFSALTCAGACGVEKVVFLKPQTYMNLSGKSVQAAVAFYKIPVEDIIVFHDDIDLQSGDVRMKQGGSDGGHNGLKSMTQLLGSGNYWRVRLGVGRPVHGGKDAVSDYVLGKFTQDELAQMTDVCYELGRRVEHVLKHDAVNALGFLKKA